MGKILITSAVDSESNLLRDQKWTHVDVVSLGVGLVAASAELSAILARTSYDRVIFTGTCGIVDAATIPMGSVICADRIVLTDLAILDGASYIPDIMTHDIALTPHGASPVTVVTCLGITKTEAGRRLLQTHFGNAAETMEAFAVADICQRHKIPCDIILGVSNQIGPDAHAQWKAHHEAASRAAQDAVRTLLGA